MDEINLNKAKAFNIKLLAYLFLYTTFSGAVRKWVLTDSLSGNIILFGQIVLPIVLVSFSKSKSLSSSNFTVSIFFVLILILMAFNPLSHTIWHGLIGILLHVGVFLPLIFYLNDRDAFPLEKLTSIFLIIAVIEGILGVIQFMAPADSIINRYARDMEVVALLSAVNKVRISGTFAYLAGQTSLFAFFGFVFWGMKLLKVNTLKVVLLLTICLVITPMTGSRGLAAMLIILVSCSILSTTTDFRNSVAFLLVFGLIFMFYQYNRVSLVDEAYTGLYARVQGHSADGENIARSVGPLEEIVKFKGQYPFLGTGLGGTYQGSISLFGESIYNRDYGYYEEEAERIVLEGGFLLFFVRLFMWFYLMRLTTIPFVFSLMLIYLNVFNSNTVFNSVSAFYTFLGIMYLDRCFYLRKLNSP
ncbi:hypothetical protein GCM10023189_31830 [Nibrella saemangeumensis]|uniref:O-antigen ligase like membrane protein n=1 Tax=Nibrella saemangeumensis TaxID=1084526 RepID=A0ABP8N3C8_9BACT